MTLVTYSTWKRMCLLFILVLVLLSIPTPALASSVLKLGSRGSEVRWLQQTLKERGYFNAEPTGYYGAVTKKAVMAFQDDRGIAIDGIAGPATIRVLKEGSDIVSTGESPGDTPWSAINIIFKVGSYATITDIMTGLSFVVRRLGGRLHADVEPVTAQDTAIMKRIFGHWSWDRRAVVVEFEDMGILYPASINGMPHSVQHIYGNNFNGHFCTHFLGSRIHKTGRIDYKHQAMVAYSSRTLINPQVRQEYLRRNYYYMVSRGYRPQRPPELIEPEATIRESDNTVQQGGLSCTELKSLKVRAARESRSPV